MVVVAEVVLVVAVMVVVVVVGDEAGSYLDDDLAIEIHAIVSNRAGDDVHHQQPDNRRARNVHERRDIHLEWRHQRDNRARAEALPTTTTHMTPKVW